MSEACCGCLWPVTNHQAQNQHMINRPQGTAYGARLLESEMSLQIALSNLMLFVPRTACAIHTECLRRKVQELLPELGCVVFLVVAWLTSMLVSEGTAGWTMQSQLFVFMVAINVLGGSLHGIWIGLWIVLQSFPIRFIDSDQMDVAHGPNSARYLERVSTGFTTLFLESHLVSGFRKAKYT